MANKNCESWKKIEKLENRLSELKYFCLVEILASLIHSSGTSSWEKKITKNKKSAFIKGKVFANFFHHSKETWNTFYAAIIFFFFHFVKFKTNFSFWKEQFYTIVKEKIISPDTWDKIEFAQVSFYHQFYWLETLLLKSSRLFFSFFVLHSFLIISNGKQRFSAS